MIAIFDWDGTLCDSIDHIVEAMQDTAAELGLAPPSVMAVRDIVGLGLPQAISQLFPALDDTQCGEVAAAYSRHFVAPGRAPAQLFDGALETLEALRGRGIELAVATGKSRRGLNRVLGTLGMEGYFDATRCVDETRSKPHPMMLQEIMVERNKRAQEVVVIGDSEYDLDMARQAGVRSVGVSFGVHDNARLRGFEPLAIVDELPQLLAMDVFTL